MLEVVTPRGLLFDFIVELCHLLCRQELSLISPGKSVLGVTEEFVSGRSGAVTELRLPEGFRKVVSGRS